MLVKANKKTKIKKDYLKLLKSSWMKKVKKK